MIRHTSSLGSSEYIFIKEISGALIKNIFEPIEETSKYDFWMKDLKRVTKLSVDEKIMH